MQMGILQTLSAVQQDLHAREVLERSRGANDFLSVARSLIASRALGVSAADWSEAARLPPSVQEVVKAGVPVMSTSSAAPLYQSMVRAFTESLRPISVLDRLLALGATRAPINALATQITTSIVAGDAAESAPKPCSSMAFSDSNMTLAKVAAFIVITSELVKVADPAAIAIFNTELRNAIAKAGNARLLSSFYGMVTPIASAGATTANVLTDLNALLDAVKTGSTSRLLYVIASDNIKGLALKTHTGGGFAFPGINIATGGELLPGISILISDELPPGAAMLLDATAFILNDQGIELDASRQATIQLESAPAPETASSVAVSLWQRNLQCLRGERIFSYAPPRTGSIAAMSGIAY
jgi:HK97 family phage major capsid protein